MDSVTPGRIPGESVKHAVGVFRLALCFAAAVLAACGGTDVTNAPIGRKSDATLRAGLVVSEPVAPPAITTTEGLGALRANQVSAVAYVSLLPGTVNDGVTASLTDLRSGYTVTVPMQDGGFDPQPIPAVSGDTIEIIVARTSGPSLQAYVVVALDTPPIIIRTNPPGGETDVPINTAIRVVMSEPIAAASVTATSVRFSTGGNVVPGVARVVAEEPYVIEFVPDSRLSGSAQYTLTIGESVTDLAGKPIGKVSFASFTTGGASAEPSLAFTSITSGSFHSCALAADGSAYCWGSNRWGQLGDGTTTERHTPVAVLGGIRFSKLSAGGGVTCGVSTAGLAYCWGANLAGTLGDGTFAPRSVPTRVLTSNTFVAIEAQAAAVCGLTAAGDAYCWGQHRTGMLGRGPIVGCPAEGCPTPAKVIAVPAFKQISLGGYYGCGITGDGAAYCWGFNAFGENGSGATGEQACWEGFWPSMFPTGPTCNFTPVPVVGGRVFASIHAGAFAACGLIASGEAYCWGANNTGVFANGAQTSISPHFVPELAASGMQFRAFINGNQRACGIGLDAMAYCWALNGSGEAGAPPSATRLLQPSPVVGGHTFAALSVGAGFTCGLTTASKLYCWGSNLYGKLGNDGVTNSYIPVLVGRQQ